MVACVRVILACALALILLPVAQAQTRKSVGPWAVVCSGGATGYCSASNRIKSVSGPYRFQLNVSRERPGAPLEVALLTGYQHPRDGADLAVQVDGGKPLQLAAGSGYRRAGRSNTYVVSADETEHLLQQMGAGQRVRFRFEDAKGATVDAAFPLSGLGGAMSFMDQMQPAPRARAPDASARAAAEQPAPTDLKPTPAAASAPAPTPSTAASERASSRAATPPAVAPAPVAKQESPAQVPTPATEPAPKETAPAPAVASTVPRDATYAPTAPAVAPAREPAVAATPSTAAAATGGSAAPAPVAAPAKAPAAQAAAVPAPKPAPEARRKPGQSQQQAAVTAAPSASRKRGAKSVRQFSCVGGEPLWTLVIDGDTARYASLTDSGQRDTVELAGKLNVTGDGPTPIIDWRGKSDWGGSFRAVVSEERCEERVSNPEGQPAFEYRAQITLPGRKTVRGCCYAGLPPAAVVAETAPTDTTQYPVADLRNRPETDWSRYLFDLLPAIQACIDKTPEPAPYATKAWPMNHGMVGVRTRNGQGGWFECVADANGKSIDRFVTLPSAAPPAPNEDRVVFSPPDHPPLGGGCYKHERVMDGMGDFMGWLSTNGCS